MTFATRRFGHQNLRPEKYCVRKIWWGAPLLASLARKPALSEAERVGLCAAVLTDLYTAAEPPVVPFDV